MYQITCVDRKFGNIYKCYLGLIQGLCNQGGKSVYFSLIVFSQGHLKKWTEYFIKLYIAIFSLVWWLVWFRNLKNFYLSKGVKDILKITRSLSLSCSNMAILWQITDCGLLIQSQNKTLFSTFKVWQKANVKFGHDFTLAYLS